MSPTTGGHAVVIGAGIGGLLAARAVAGAYERVTVVERDALPARDEPRRAVPQGRHVHTLLPRGQMCLEELLPGLSAELVADGAHRYMALDHVRMVINGHLLARGSTGRHGVVASRPFLEGHVRRRVAALPEVELIDRCDVLGLQAAGDGAVTGVRILRRAPGSAAETLDADFVVASSGRGARLPAWLEELGCARPPEERLDIDIGYASQELRLPPGALGTDKLVLLYATPDRPRGLIAFVQEDGRWLLTLHGYAGHHPPADPEAFLAFARTIAPPDVMHAIEAAEPLGPIAVHRFAADLRRRYDRLSRLPRGFVPFGDAICAFNPLFGQGITVAARQAVALRDCVRAGRHDLERRFVRAAIRETADAWQLATTADLAQPGVNGRRSAQVRFVNAYLRRLHARAADDPALALTFIRVVGMLDRPQRLLHPAVAVRVLAPRRHARSGARQSATPTLTEELS